MIKCVYCDSDENLTIDHIIPKWLFNRMELLGLKKVKKTFRKKNTQILCRKCNSIKSGGIDVRSDVGMRFWVELRDFIDKKIQEQ
jgi:5-methylcytosine-specific restriction endonuclease McrA